MKLPWIGAAVMTCCKTLHEQNAVTEINSKFSTEFGETVANFQQRRLLGLNILLLPVLNLISKNGTF